MRSRGSIFLEKGIRVLIVSYGGVGTSFLAEAISKYVETNHFEDEDGYKHLPIPPIGDLGKTKVIYVYGDPIISTVSLFRRGFHVYQSKKLQRFKLRKRPISESVTLEEYAINGVDALLFEEHFRNWRHRFLMYPSMFLKYDKIHENIQNIISFLELPDEFLETFPKKIVRSTKIQDLSKVTRDGLENMYARFRGEVKMMPAIEVIMPSRWSAIKYLNPVYAIALLAEFRNAMRSGIRSG